MTIPNIEEYVPKTKDWAEAIYERIITECPYEETNNVIARIVKEAIINDPKLLKELIGTLLIEENYFTEPIQDAMIDVLGELIK